MPIKAEYIVLQKWHLLLRSVGESRSSAELTLAAAQCRRGEKQCTANWNVAMIVLPDGAELRQRIANSSEYLKAVLSLVIC